MPPLSETDLQSSPIPTLLDRLGQGQDAEIARAIALRHDQLVDHRTALYRAMDDLRAANKQVEAYESAKLPDSISDIEREWAEYDAAREKDGKWVNGDHDRVRLMRCVRALRAQLNVYEVKDLPAKLAEIEGRHSGGDEQSAAEDRGTLLRVYREIRAEYKGLVDYIRKLAPCGLCDEGVLKEEMRLCVRCGGYGWVRNAQPFAEVAEFAFSEGMRAAEMGWGSECAHPENSLKRHWWTRGYAHQTRIFRAILAEKERDDLQTRLNHMIDRLQTAWEGICRYRRVLCPPLRFVGQTETGAKLDVDEWEKDNARTFPQERPCPT